MPCTLAEQNGFIRDNEINLSIISSESLCCNFGMPIDKLLNTYEKNN